jgi:hypothetical protein
MLPFRPTQSRLYLYPTTTTTTKLDNNYISIKAMTKNTTKHKKPEQPINSARKTKKASYTLHIFFFSPQCVFVYHNMTIVLYTFIYLPSLVCVSLSLSIPLLFQSHSLSHSIVYSYTCL